MDRRSFLTSSALAVGVTTLGPSFWQQAYAAHPTPGTGPYGGLRAPDANGVMLPNGFTSRILATTGSVVAGTAYVWHRAPDGGAVFPQPDGGWVYTSNSEVPLAGGAGALRFTPGGQVSDAYRSWPGRARTAPAVRRPGAHGSPGRSTPSASSMSARSPRPHRAGRCPRSGSSPMRR